MSLCRWSSDNFRCDLYCYESHGGFVTHVASSRLAGNLPMTLLEAVMRKEELGLTSEQVTEIGRAHSKALEKAERIPIGLKHDGASFVDENLSDWRARIAGLVQLGYCVPDGVIDEIDDLIVEERDATSGNGRMRPVCG